MARRSDCGLPDESAAKLQAIVAERHSKKAESARKLAAALRAAASQDMIRDSMDAGPRPYVRHDERRSPTEQYARSHSQQCATTVTKSISADLNSLSRLPSDAASARSRNNSFRRAMQAANCFFSSEPLHDTYDVDGRAGHEARSVTAQGKKLYTADSACEMVLTTSLPQKAATAAAAAGPPAVRAPSLARRVGYWCRSHSFK